MIIYLYGLPGVGKNYIGEIINKYYNYYFKDGDDYLTPIMKFKLKKGKHFTEKEVTDYHDIIAKEVLKLSKIHKNLVISQASLKKSNRDKIIKLVPSVVFINVHANIETIINRIEKRNGYVTKQYAKDLVNYLEVPKNEIIIINDKSENYIIKQLELIVIG